MKCEEYYHKDCAKGYQGMKRLECEYCLIKADIEEEWNFWNGPIFMRDIICLIRAKKNLEGSVIEDLKFMELLNKAIDLIWDLLKEKKVKVQRYEIEEYEKPREIEKVMFWGKLRKKYITNWMWKQIWRLDPCKYKDNKKLEEDVENWKIETLALYKYVLEKYGQDKASRLLDILEIVRSDCYEWEVKIE